MPRIQFQFKWREGIELEDYFITYREPAVEQLVLVDRREALCDPRDGVAGLALAQHLAAEDGRVRISCGERRRK